MRGPVHIIINPASGQDRPVLGAMNRAFQAAGVDWEVFVTKRGGDAGRFAEQAVAAGVEAVGVYGGDGTVAEVAGALVGTNVPLAVFPGGTANVISLELGVPGDLEQALALVCAAEREIRTIDVGEVDGRYFLIRVGIGFEAQLIKGADRELKSRLGLLAYTISGLQTLRDPPFARYRLTIDGRQVRAQGVTCMLANAGNLGRTNLTLAPSIGVSDGVLDVVVVRSTDIGALISMAAAWARGEEPTTDVLERWQAREVSVEAEPPQIVQVDGEIVGKTPVHARVIPRAIRVVVPKTPSLN